MQNGIDKVYKSGKKQIQSIRGEQCKFVPWITETFAQEVNLVFACQMNTLINSIKIKSWIWKQKAN